MKGNKTEEKGMSGQKPEREEKVISTMLSKTEILKHE